MLSQKVSGGRAGTGVRVSGEQRRDDVAGTAAGIWTDRFTAERFEAAHAGTLPGLLGIRLTEIGPDFVRAEMPVDERHAQPYGILHGGGSVVLAETVGSFSGAMAAPPGSRVVGVEVNANHLAPAFKGDAVTALCRPLRIGRTLVGRLLMYDAMEEEFRELKLEKDPDCPMCGVNGRHSLDGIDYTDVGCAVPALTSAAAD